MEFKQVAKILPVFKENTSLVQHTLPPFKCYHCLNLLLRSFHFTSLCCSAWLYHHVLTISAARGGKFAHSFPFPLQHFLQMLPSTALQLPPSYGKCSTAASEKSWCKCKMCSKGINTEENISEKNNQKPDFSLLRHLYLNTFLFCSLHSWRSLLILISSEDLC